MAPVFCYPRLLIYAEVKSNALIPDLYGKIEYLTG